MKNNTEIQNISVEIDGNLYPIAAKTVAIADQLASIAAKNADQPRYKTWLAQMCVIIGELAVANLFPHGDDENLDRMEAIYAGVMDAFDYNGQQLRSQREQAGLDHMRDMASTLSTLASAVSVINEKYPGIMRPKSEG